MSPFFQSRDDLTFVTRVALTRMNRNIKATRQEMWRPIDNATHCNTLQHTAARYNALQRTATHCNTVQHATTRCNTLQQAATHCSVCGEEEIWRPMDNTPLQHTATHCNTAHCNTLHHISLRCITLQHTTTHCNTLQHPATPVGRRRCGGNSTMPLFIPYMSSIRPCVLQRVAVCCSELQCVAVCCSELTMPLFMPYMSSIRPCVLQCVAVCCSVLQCVAVCCSMLQCVAVCCSVLQCVLQWANSTLFMQFISSIKPFTHTYMYM